MALQPTSEMFGMPENAFTLSGGAADFVGTAGELGIDIRDLTRTGVLEA